MSREWPGGITVEECPPFGQNCVYLLSNTVNGMKYVGMTWSLRRRIKDHKKGNSGSKSYIKNAIKTYGINSFDLAILFVGSRRECMEQEKQFIDKYGCLAPSGYNLCGGGEGVVAAMTGERNYWYGRKFSSEHKAKISAAHRGQKRPPEMGQKLREKFKGRPIPLEQRAKISASLMGRRGHPTTEKTKELLREAAKKQWLKKRHIMMEAMKQRGSNHLS